MLRSSSTSAIVGIVGALAAIDVVKMLSAQGAGFRAAVDYGSFGARYATRHYRGATNMIVAQVNKSPEMPTKSEIAASARALMRRAFKGSLASIDARERLSLRLSYHAARPMLRMRRASSSRSSRATPRTSLRDSRASIMVDETGALADPLQGARVTIYGRAEPDAGAGGEAAISRPASRGRRSMPTFRISPSGR